MPRSKQYEVNEAFASSQSTIVVALNENAHDGKNHVGAPPRPKKSVIPTGWLVGMFFGALCIAFILCVAFVNIPGVPTVRKKPERAVMLHKEGYIRMFPSPFVDRSHSRTKFLLLPNMTSPVQQLRDVLSGYPSEYTETYTTCCVCVPTYSRPCYFEKTWLGSNCTENNDFGYKEVDGMINPCILLRLENLTDWRPVVYKRSAVDESWIDVYDPNFSNVDCSITGKRNKEKKKIDIYPEKGLANHFFPVSKFDKSLYLIPSVMIQIVGLPVGESIELQCWIRVSNAYMLKDEGEIVINITMTDTFTSTTSTSSSAQQDAATTTEVSTTASHSIPTTPPSTVKNFDFGSN